MIKILIVDDSKTECEILRYIFEAEKDMKVVGFASNGQEALKLVPQLNPDIITMDIHMPIMNGFETTRHIMKECPKPIIVISSKINDELNDTYLALEAGALSVLEKPHDISSKEFTVKRKHMVDTIRTMSEIKVVKRRFFISKPVAKSEEPPRRVQRPPILPLGDNHYEIIAIGASVGGPQALKTILSNLSPNFPVPIVIVQHMTNGFINGFAQWLDKHITLTVKEAENEEILKPGTVYFAPDNSHLIVERVNTILKAKLVTGKPVAGFYPSITMLLNSIAKTCGSRGVGLLLTGMGFDGSEGLLELKKASGYTLIQDPDSAVVFGMAGVAQSLGAVDEVVTLSALGNRLMNMVSKESNS